MSTPSPLAEVFRRVLTQPTGGVVGLVDDLLSVCGANRLQLDWQAGRCRVRPSGGDGEEWIDVPLGTSVFRAVLARLATLCNERTPHSVSPYGGQGELSVGANAATVFRVTFSNTPAEQKLQLRTVGEQPAVLAAGNGEDRRGPGQTTNDCDRRSADAHEFVGDAAEEGP